MAYYTHIDDIVKPSRTKELYIVVLKLPGKAPGTTPGRDH